VKPAAQRGLLVATAALLVAHALWVLWLTTTRLNYVQVDAAGHLASAAQLARGQWHDLVDQSFLGYVHGLFYPPLEDLILAALRGLSGDWLVAYHIYVAAIWLGLLAALWAVARRLEPLVALGFVVAMLWMLSTRRPGIAYQGLSLWDTLVIGLTSEVLATSFLLLLLGEWLRPAPRTWVLAVTATLTVCTHMVMGLAAAALLGAMWLAVRDRQALRAGLWTTGATAFFWLPFWVARGRLVGTLIVAPPAYVATWAAACVVALAWPARKARALAIAGAVLIVVGTVASVLVRHQVHPPPLHWHRFAAPALLLILIAAAWIAATPGALWRRLAAALLLLGLPLFELRQPLHPGTADGNAFVPTTPDLSGLGWDPGAPYGRQWTIEDDRSSAAGLDALASVRDPSYRGLKGLYWEAARENTLLSSFMATLYAPPTVLDYAIERGLSCAQEVCMIETMARMYNVTRIAWDPIIEQAAMTRGARACFRQLAREHRIGDLELTRAGTMIDGSHHYDVWRLTPAAAAPVDLRAVEPLEPGQLRTVPDGARDAYLTVFQAATRSCRAGAQPTTEVYTDRSALPRLVGATARRAEVRATALRRTGDGQLEVTIDSPRPALVWIKLSWFPGARLVDAAGHDHPLVPAWPGMLAIGQGKLTLIVGAPRLASELGLGLSLATVLLALGLVLRRRRARP
jgi:hypothetical protein